MLVAKLASRARRTFQRRRLALTVRSGQDGGGAQNTDAQSSGFGRQTYGQGGQRDMISISRNAQGGRPYFDGTGQAGQNGRLNGPGGNGGDSSGSVAYEAGGGVRRSAPSALISRRAEAARVPALAEQVCVC